MDDSICDASRIYEIVRLNGERRPSFHYVDQGAMRGVAGNILCGSPDDI